MKKLQWFLVNKKYPRVIRSQRFDTKEELVKHWEDNIKMYEKYQTQHKMKFKMIKDMIEQPKPLTDKEKKELKEISESLNQLIRNVFK